MIRLCEKSSTDNTVSVLIDIYKGNVTKEIPNLKDKFTPLYKRMLQCIYDKEVK